MLQQDLGNKKIQREREGLKDMCYDEYQYRRMTDINKE
jgi:hypothetical protein